MGILLSPPEVIHDIVRTRQLADPAVEAGGLAEQHRESSACLACEDRVELLSLRSNASSSMWNNREISSLCVKPYAILKPQFIKCSVVAIMWSRKRSSNGASNLTSSWSTE